ncbi:MAG: heavy-metal-associated domain-containing protein [Bacteroidales bacterium]|nr:heavy-metal-associated domain-containing protein [Bacteroidales bacterium]
MKKIALLLLAFTVLFGVNAQTKKDVQTIVIQTNGVCGKCQEKIMGNIPYEKGVTDCNYDMKTSKVTVTYNPSKTNPDNIRQAISKLGYDADDVKADAAARAKLPACCRAEKGSCGAAKDANGHCPGHAAAAKETPNAAPAKKTAPNGKENLIKSKAPTQSNQTTKKDVKPVERAATPNSAPVK